MRNSPNWIAALAAFAALPASALPAQGQINEIMRVVGEGGRWVQLPVTAGRASFESPVVPTFGLVLNGCVRVWDGHSGAWTIRARDSIGGSELDLTAEPGEPVRFELASGMQAQVSVAIEWSEARDTTLYAWVGLAPPTSPPDQRDICEPTPGEYPATPG